jgi:hypothetical protein
MHVCIRTKKKKKNYILLETFIFVIIYLVEEKIGELNKNVLENYNKKLINLL